MPKKKIDVKEQEESISKLSNKEKALQLTLESIQKDFGKGTILSGNEQIPGIDWFSSGCLSFNKALSGDYNKGYPRGRIIEVYGPASSGKTTICLHAIAEMQKLDEIAAFIDIEHAFDPIYANNLGVNIDDLLFSQPQSGEDALQVASRLISSGALGLVIIDSVAALTPKAELEGEIGDSHVGRQARLMSQAMRMLSGRSHRTNTTVIFINQIRMKIGISFGSPETTAGGNALKFYSSQRIDIRRTGGIKGKEDDAQFIANTTRVKIVKNKVAAPFRLAEFQIKYGEGIDIMQDLLSVATNHNIVEKAGSWYSYNGDRLGQGEANSIQTLKAKPELVEEIKSKLSI